MNNDFILRRTGNFSDFLLKFLANPESAKHYLEVALEEYEKDGNTEILANAIRTVVEAQGGVEKLASRTNGSLQRLYRTLEAKHTLSLDNLFEILTGLGFHTRVCVDRAVVNEDVNAYTEDMLALEPMDGTG